MDQQMDEQEDEPREDPSSTVFAVVLARRIWRWTRRAAVVWKTDMDYCCYFRSQVLVNLGPDEAPVSDGGHVLPLSLWIL